LHHSVIRIPHGLNHLLRFLLSMCLVPAFFTPIKHLRPIPLKNLISFAGFLDDCREPSMISELPKIVLENLASQIFVVEIFGPRELRNARFEATFDRIADQVVRAAIPIAGEQSQSVSEPLLSQIL